MIGKVFRNFPTSWNSLGTVIENVFSETCFSWVGGGCSLKLGIDNQTICHTMLLNSMLVRGDLAEILRF
jgi:hypothetical protein